jgi:HNH endonuclease
MLKCWTLTHEQALSRYRYDPATGIVIGPRDKPVGHVKLKNHPGSRRKVVVERAGEGCIPLARLIWFLVTGKWPDAIIDHINADPLDQRWVNLRLATVAENNCNSAQRIGISGYRNVVRGSHGKGWRVDFDRKMKGAPRQQLFLSRKFATPEEAAALADKIRAKLHGEYASTRKRP